MSWSQIMAYATMICIQNRDQNISKISAFILCYGISMMKLLAILQVKADKTITTESYSTRQ